MRDIDLRTGRWGARSVALAFSLAVLLGTSPKVSPAFSVTIDADSGSAADSFGTSGWEKGSKDVVRMGQDIEIGPGETVQGDVVAIGGHVTIAGKVQGDAVSIGGGIHLLSGSVVNGDVVTVGGKLDREAGATVLGQNVSVGPAGALGWIPHVGHGRYRHQENLAGRIAKDIAKCLIFFIVGLIIYFAFPKRMGVVRETIKSRFWLSLVVGFGSLIGVSAAIVLLCITCIGIFVAVPGALIFILAVIATAAVAVGLLGEVISRRTVTAQSGWIPTVVIGLAVLCGVEIISRLLTSADGGFVYGLGQTIRVVVKTAWAVLMMVGFGSLILSRLGSGARPTPPWAIPATQGAATTPPVPPPAAPIG